MLDGIYAQSASNSRYSSVKTERNRRGKYEELAEKVVDPLIEEMVKNEESRNNNAEFQSKAQALDGFEGKRHQSLQRGKPIYLFFLTQG